VAPLCIRHKPSFHSSHTVAIGKGSAPAIGTRIERAWKSVGGATADLSVADPEIARLIAAQERQNRTTVNLVASETYCPAATLAAETSEFVNKNAGGYPPRVSFNGGATMDAIERLAIERAKGIFGAEHANIQSLSATIANIAVLRALLQPGDRLMGFGIAAGGRNSHGDAYRNAGGGSRDIHGDPRSLYRRRGLRPSY
jgi:glycine/serine hydroxymethyltransferase